MTAGRHGPPTRWTEDRVELLIRLAGAPRVIADDEAGDMLAKINELPGLPIKSIGAVREKIYHFAPRTEPKPVAPIVVEDRSATAARWPLPPGHQYTWGAITAGTVLDGSGYPHRSNAP